MYWPQPQLSGAEQHNVDIYLFLIVIFMLSHANTAFKVVEYLAARSASNLENVFLKSGSPGLSDYITFNSKI